jgi:hypothetical protein
MKFDFWDFNENLSRKPEYGYNRQIYQAFYLEIQAHLIVSGDNEWPLNAPFE